MPLYEIRSGDKSVIRNLWSRDDADRWLARLATMATVGYAEPFRVVRVAE